MHVVVEQTVRTGIHTDMVLVTREVLGGWGWQRPHPRPRINLALPSLRVSGLILVTPLYSENYLLIKVGETRKTACHQIPVCLHSRQISV